MKMTSSRLLTLGLLLLVSLCGTGEINGQEKLSLFDSARNRSIPVALYRPPQQDKPAPLILFSHGYGGNQPGSNLQYSYLTKRLAEAGYWVASIQHELPADSLLPATGIPQVVRRSNWERGAENIKFVLKQLSRTVPGPDYSQVVIMGHSNGGDMSMLLAQQDPGLACKVITLDNRRVAIPRSRHPRLYSLRSSDQPADEGVLPDAAAQKRFGITIIRLPATIHNNMDDKGTVQQKEEIVNYILRFLKD